MTIRHATTADINPIIELISQLGYEINKEQVASNLHLYEKLQGFVFVCEEEQRIIAFASGCFIPLFHSNEMMFRITALCVHDSKRGAGVGKELIQKLEEVCRKKDCNYIEVTSGPQRKTDAHVFYENLGYRVYKGKRFTKRLDRTNSSPK
ncbi:MAG: GNAT family N-acetyltransferase [Flavisolibacter sp.]|jgi:N-acetylglutamate synthase-like GNAT family acetyltransferase